MSEIKILVDIPFAEIGADAHNVIRIVAELLGIDLRTPVTHPDFIDGATAGAVLSTAVATLAREWFAKGSDAGARAVIAALGGKMTVISDGIHGNATG